MALISIGSIGWQEILVTKELYDAVIQFLEKNSINIKAYGDVTVEHPSTATELVQGIDID